MKHKQAIGVKQPKKDEHGGRILVLDDDRSIRLMFNKLLPMIGYRVSAVDNGEEAIREYAQALADDDRFDLVILDLTIPGGMGGERVLESLTELDPKVRAAAFSGDANHPAMLSPKEHGFFMTLGKPLDFSAIRAAMRKLRGERR